MKKAKQIFRSAGIFILYLTISTILDSYYNIVFTSSNPFISYTGLILANFIPALVITLFFVPDIVEGFKNLNKKDLKIAYKNWIFGLAIMFVSNIIISLFSHSIATNESYNRELLFKMPLYAISAMVIIAPFIEELIFRLSIRDIFTNKWRYAIVSGFIFGLMHLITATSLIEFLYIIPYGALGFFFAKTVYETDNIICSILTHMTHNAAIISLLYLAYFLGD